MRKLVTVLVVLLSLTLTFAFAGNSAAVQKGDQAFMEKVPGNFEPATYLLEQQKLYDWLVAEAVDLSPESIIRVQVTAEEEEEMMNSDCATCGQNQKIRVGIAKPVSRNVNFGDSAREKVISTPDGGFVWTVAAESINASALRFHITDLNLPANAALYIYNATGQAFGPYTNRGPNQNGDFWTNTVTGSVAFMQVHYFGQATPEAKASIQFKIAGVAHLGSKFLLPFMQQPQAEAQDAAIETICSFNADCVVDASCYSSSAIADAKYGVAHMQFVSGPWVYICSGGLLNDTVATSQIPYFLTANHCISADSEAESLECYWQFWTSSCNGACYNPVGAVPRTLGSAIVQTSATSDYCLLQLDEAPPAGSVFMGWNSTAVAYNNGANLYRVSHPGGAPQAYSHHQVDTSKGTCRDWPRGDWIYSQDIEGATEGGSSGSPVVNSSGQVVGQLSGACGYNTGDPCDSTSNATVDGAFAAYYDDVKQWLNPTTTTNQPPVANFTFATNVLTANFTDTSTDSDGTVVSWSWNFGDGSTSTQQNPSHTYASAGTYTVTLTVTDNDGDSDSISKSVTVSTGGTVEMYVDAISLTITRAGKNYSGTAVITIRDTNGSPVVGATVNATWSGVVSENDTAITDGNGQVTVKSAKIKSITGPFTVTVTNVTHATITYNASLNNVTSATASY